MVTRSVIRITAAEAAAAKAKAKAKASPSKLVEGTAGNTFANNNEIRNSMRQSDMMSKSVSLHFAIGENDSISLKKTCSANAAKKRYVSTEEPASNKKSKKRRRRSNSFTIDLSDVPPQPPIPKIDGGVKDKASKYVGVTWNKSRNIWVAAIIYKGKLRYIGSYENEEEAGIDYARAVYKYRGKEAHEKSKKRQRSNLCPIDLSGVPPQSPITRVKKDGRMKDNASKYEGVSWDKSKNKWYALIFIEGKQRRIGHYGNEEDAGTDYARALYKYKGKVALEAKEMRKKFVIDLSDVPPQAPIRKDTTNGRMNTCTSKYIGVSWSATNNKWSATITIEGKQHLIGYYVKEEEAAIDYARAMYKYRGKKAHQKAKKSLAQYLGDVPTQSPITRYKTNVLTKDCTSKYVGVSWHKKKNKWSASITIEGKVQYIGCYDNEEEAGFDYARALYKYKGKEALDKARVKAPQIKLNLSDVPSTSPILKSGKCVTGTS